MEGRRGPWGRFVVGFVARLGVDDVACAGGDERADIRDVSSDGYD